MSQDYEPLSPISSLKLALAGALVGVSAGLAAVAFHWVISSSEAWRKILYTHHDFVHLAFYIVGILAISWLVSLLLKWAPYSNGSGIPQVRAEVMGQLDDQPFPTLISKFAGGSLLGIIGFSLGREGPSIQMGAMAGKLTTRWLKIPDQQGTFLLTAGASAGLSAAFNAPLAGVLFAVEELFGYTNPQIILPSLSASLVANYLSFHLMGYENSFAFTAEEPLPLSSIAILFALGIACGLVGVSFNTSLEKLRQLMARLPVKKSWLIFMVGVMVLALAYSFPAVLGGGHSLIESLHESPHGLSFLLVALVLKILLTCLCFDSGVQGGIFLPVLVMGALTGSIFGQVQGFGWLSQGYEINLVILGMVGVLTAVVRAPMMSIILISEMVGSLDHLVNLGIVALVAMVTAELMKCQPVYHTLYDNLMKRIHGDKVGEPIAFEPVVGEKEE